MGRIMKDSGLPWIKKIPNHWRIMPNKYVMSKLKEIQDIYRGEDIISLSTDGVKVRDLNAGGKMPTTFDGYQRIKPGRLLMCLFDMDVTPRCIGLIKNEGLTSPAYSQFVMKELGYAPFYYYYYLNLDYDKTLVHLAKNLRHSLTEDQLGAINVVVPPFEEQRAIADYLDKKTADIDAAIKEAQELIDKYKSYKQSIITEAVTKGLAPNVPMKDSGAEWIGEIPEHWKVKKVKYLFKKGKGLSITKEDLRDKGQKVISYGQVHSKLNSGTSIKIDLIRFVDDSYLRTSPNAIVPKGGFIFADTSEDLEGCGNAVYNDSEDTIFAGYHTIILFPINSTENKYFAYLFFSDLWRKQIRTRVSGVKVLSVSQNIIDRCSLIVPSPEEQQAIADYLDDKCSQIDSIISNKENLISQLQEYRKSIIFEYVTGKKEVPNG